jgi:hypothetical protein
MLPNHYVCTACLEQFQFKFKEAVYYVGTMPLGARLPDRELLRVPMRPAWCKDCDDLCVAEDIAPLRAFEDAYGAARRGQRVEYPVETGYAEMELAASLVEPYLRWRLVRRHPERALCCGGRNFQFMDVEQPLLKHVECEHSSIEPRYWIGSYCGPGPGVRSPANIPVFDAEGERIALLTWRRHTESDICWEVEFSTYIHTCE